MRKVKEIQADIDTLKAELAEAEQAAVTFKEGSVFIDDNGSTYLLAQVGFGEFNMFYLTKSGGANRCSGVPLKAAGRRRAALLALVTSGALPRGQPVMAVDQVATLLGISLEHFLAEYKSLGRSNVLTEAL